MVDLVSLEIGLVFGVVWAWYGLNMWWWWCYFISGFLRGLSRSGHVGVSGMCQCGFFLPPFFCEAGICFGRVWYDVLV